MSRFRHRARCRRGGYPQVARTPRAGRIRSWVPSSWPCRCGEGDTRPGTGDAHHYDGEISVSSRKGIRKRALVTIFSVFCWYTEKVFVSFSQCGLARYISFSAEQASSFKIGGVFSLIWSMVWEVAVLLVFTECLYGHGVAGQFRSPLQAGFPTWYLFTGVSSSCPGALSRRVWLSSSIWRNYWTFPSSRSFVVRINVLGHEVYGDLHVCWLKRFLWDVVITAAVLDVALTGHGCSTSRWPLRSC